MQILAKDFSIVPLAAIKPYDGNSRKHSARQVDKIAASIAEFGFNAPILIDADMTIVAGHGRYAVSGDPRLMERTGGLVPVVVVELDPTPRMMSTIRHNRARGEHGVLPMANIVRTIYEEGAPQDEIQKRLGMEDEEVERLLDRSGMTIRGSAEGFGRAWVPTAK